MILYCEINLNAHVLSNVDELSNMDKNALYEISDPIGIVLQLIVFIWNVLLLVVLCRLKTPRRSYFSLVRSLTVADTLMPLTRFIVILHFQYFPSTDVVMDFIASIVQTYSICVTVLHLICLAAEHYVAIMKPLCYEEWCRRRYTICRLVLSWTSPLLIAITERTVIMSEKYIIIIIISGLIAMCFLMMLVVYILIVHEVFRQQRLENSQNRHARKNYRALITTILNLVTFFLCWMPFVVREVWWFLIYEDSSDWSVTFTLFTEIARNIMGVNSLCDALIYSIRLTEVQKMWRRTFCCICRCFNGSHDK